MLACPVQHTCFSTWPRPATRVVDPHAHHTFPVSCLAATTPCRVRLAPKHPVVQLPAPSKHSRWVDTMPALYQAHHLSIDCRADMVAARAETMVVPHMPVPLAPHHRVTERVHGHSVSTSTSQHKAKRPGATTGCRPTGTHDDLLNFLPDDGPAVCRNSQCCNIYTHTQHAHRHITYLAPQSEPVLTL